MQFHKKTSVGKYSFVIRLLAKLALLVLLVFFTSLILIKMSCPNVKPLMKPSESMVDMIVAINPVMNIPESNGGRTSYANSG